MSIKDEYNQEKEFEIKRRLNDEEAIREIKKKLKISNILEIQKYNTDYRDKIIKEINSIDGITKEQLSRIIGVSKRTIYRAIAK